MGAAESTLAQETDTLEASLPPVTVEAARAAETTLSAPFALTVLHRAPDEVRTETATSLQDVLATVPGVWINDRGHFAMGERIIVRGTGWRSSFGVRGVMVVLDGVPLTMPDGQAFADVVDPSRIRSAEIIRGPASVFWGNASGGVVYLKTMPHTGGPRLRFRGMTGTFGERHLLAESSFSVGRGSVALFGSHQNRDGFRSHSSGRFDRAGLHARIPVGARTVITATAAGALQDAENPGALTAAELELDRSQVSPSYISSVSGKESLQLQFSVGADRATSIGTVSASVFGVRRDLDNPLPFAYIDVDRLAGGARLSVSSDPARRLRWSAGGDVGRQADDRRNFENDAGRPGAAATLNQLETVTNAAAYAYGSAMLTPSLDLSLGVRADVIHFEMEDRLLDNGDESGDRGFRAISPAVGLSYQAGSAFLFANFGTSFETPTTTELVNRPDATGGFNPLLEPERARSIEAGARGSALQRRVAYEVAVFRSTVDNILVQSESPDGREYFRNAGTNTHAGVEASVQMAVLPYLHVLTTYAYNHLRFASGALEGNALPGVPEHRLFARLTFSRAGFRVAGSGESVSSYFVDEDNSATTPAYTVLTLHAAHAGIRLGRARLQPFGEIENLLDARYNASVVVNAFGGRYFEPGSGRVFRVGMNLLL